MHIHLAGLTREEKKLFRRLNTQVKIQDYLETIPANFETGGQTLHSPRSVLKYNTAHCFEGALLACAILLSQGHKAVILDLQPDIKSNDDGHALALFKVNGLFGALSKTNHPSIRYRDPIYKSIRELVMSYFHEYFLSDGAKNLRSYTILNLSKIKKNWITDSESVWYVERLLEEAKYIDVLPKKKVSLRKAEQVEIDASKNTVWQ